MTHRNRSGPRNPQQINRRDIGPPRMRLEPLFRLSESKSIPLRTKSPDQIVSSLEPTPILVATCETNNQTLEPVCEPQAGSNSLPASPRTHDIENVVNTKELPKGELSAAAAMAWSPTKFSGRKRGQSDTIESTPASRDEERQKQPCPDLNSVPRDEQHPAILESDTNKNRSRASSQNSREDAFITDNLPRNCTIPPILLISSDSQMA